MAKYVIQKIQSRSKRCINLKWESPRFDEDKRTICSNFNWNGVWRNEDWSICVILFLEFWCLVSTSSTSSKRCTWHILRWFTKKS